MTVGAACSSPSLGFFGAGLATSRVPELKSMHDLQAHPKTLWQTLWGMTKITSSAFCNFNISTWKCMRYLELYKKYNYF